MPQINLRSKEEWVSFDFGLHYSCLLNAKDTEVVELENDGWDFSISFRYKQNSNHMAIEVMILKTIAVITKRPRMDANYWRGNRSTIRLT